MTSGARMSARRRRVIGRGGMGIVLKGRDTRLDRIVAIKVLAPELASNPTARRRFLREAQILDQLDHPDICKVYDLITDSQLPLSVTSLKPGLYRVAVTNVKDWKGKIRLFYGARSGLELLAEVARRDPEVPRLMLTGYADKENAIRAINEVGLFQ